MGQKTSIICLKALKKSHPTINIPESYLINIYTHTYMKIVCQTQFRLRGHGSNKSPLKIIHILGVYHQVACKSENGPSSKDAMSLGKNFRHTGAYFEA